MCTVVPSPVTTKRRTPCYSHAPPTYLVSSSSPPSLKQQRIRSSIYKVGKTLQTLVNKEKGQDPDPDPDPQYTVVRIRIIKVTDPEHQCSGSMSLTNGFCYFTNAVFVMDLQDANKKLIYKKIFSLY